MKRSCFYPETLCGATRTSLPVPTVFAQDIRRHGHAIDAAVLNSIGYRNSLADEFCGASGFRFDWGLVVAGFPDWYYPRDYRPDWVWRIIPTGLWERATAHHHLPQAIHETALLLRRDGNGALWPRLPGWVEADPGLSYDLCALLVRAPKDAARLFALLEREVLPQLLPPVLRLVEAHLLQVLKGSGTRLAAPHSSTLH